MGIQHVVAAILLLLCVLAGCTTPAPPSPPADDEAAGLAFLEANLVNDHDHSDPAAHPGASWHMHDVFESTLPMNGSGSTSPPSEFTIWSHYAFVSLFHPSAGFVILDIADAALPREVGRFDAGTADTNDVEVSADGRWAFVPTMPLVTAENDAAGGGLPYIGDGGLQVVDLADLSHPTLATFWRSPGSTVQGVPGGNGWHRLDIEVIGGATYIFGTNNALAQIDIVRFDATPAPHVTPVATYQSPEGMQAALNRQDGFSSYNIHDVTVDPDPLSGKPLMAVAHWRGGAHFVDVSDPANPKFLGKWDAFTVVMPGNVHNVEFTAIEGHRIAVVAPEYPTSYPRQGILWIVDATDFVAPKLIGTWQLPGLHPAEGGTYMFSTDRTEIRNGTLFVPHMHAGLIVLDVSTLAKAQQPVMLGFVQPHGRTAIPYLGYTTDPVVYDAIPRGKYVYYTDLLGAFHVAEMDESVVRGNAW
ncbi:MAG: hypothetical protein V4510_08440 [bacterium]